MSEKMKFNAYSSKCYYTCNGIVRIESKPVCKSSKMFNWFYVSVCGLVGLVGLLVVGLVF